MHKIQEKPFSVNDISCDMLMRGNVKNGDPELKAHYKHMTLVLDSLNNLRDLYLKTGDKKYWRCMIEMLPSSYNQTRNVMLNYEVLANIYKSRKSHPLNEWVEFCKWIKELPYSELICGDGALITQNEQREILEDVADKFCEIGNINPLSKEEIEQSVNLSRIKED